MVENSGCDILWHFTVQYNASWISLGGMCRSCLNFSPLSEQVYRTQPQLNCWCLSEPRRWWGSSSCYQNWSCRPERNYRWFWAESISTERLRETPEVTNPLNSRAETQQPKSFLFGCTAFCVFHDASHFGTVVHNLVAPLITHQLLQTSQAVWILSLIWIITLNHFNRCTYTYMHIAILALHVKTKYCPLVFYEIVECFQKLKWQNIS